MFHRCSPAAAKLLFQSRYASVEKPVSSEKMNGDKNDPVRRCIECRQTGTLVPLKCATGVKDTQSSIALVSAMKLMQHWSDMVTAQCADEQTSGGVLHRLDFLQQVLRHSIQQRVAPVQATRYKCLENCLSSINFISKVLPRNWKPYLGPQKIAVSVFFGSGRKPRFRFKNG